jgi:hypothetical protein
MYGHYHGAVAARLPLARRGRRIAAVPKPALACLFAAVAACAPARRAAPPPVVDAQRAELPPLDPRDFPALVVRSATTDEVLYEGARSERARAGQRTFDLDGFGTLRIDLKNGEIVACRATYEGLGFDALAIYATTFCNAGIAEARMVCFDAAELPLVTGPKDAPHRSLRVDGCIDLLAPATP